MFVNFNILNQLGSPAINSNTFANRPAAGQTGRLFVSTDTFEIYRDNGTTWDLIGGPGSSTITGTGQATEVAFFTSSQAIASSANLFWDNTNQYLGIGTSVPNAGVNVQDVDALGVLSNITTFAGTSTSSVSVWAKNTTNSAGYAGIFEEITPNSAAGQYPIKISHTLSSGTAAANMATGIHFGLPDNTGTERINQLSVDTVDPIAATYSNRYRFLLRSNGAAVTPFYITGTGLGVFTATPGVALDIHSTGIMAQLNSTSATANSLLAFQRSGSGLWRIGDQYNAGNNFFELHNTVLTSNAIQVLASSNEATFSSTKTYSTGNSIGVAVQHNLTIPNAVNVGLAAIGGVNSNLNLTLGGSTTVAATGRQGLEGSTSIRFTGAGTLTMTQASTVRAFSALSSVYAFNGSAVGTITHLAGLRICFPDNSGSAVNITNNYALLINDQTTGTGTVTYTNRWGIYQEGSSDLNYFAGNSLFGTTTNVGAKIAISGYMYISNRPLAQIVFNSTGTYYGQLQNDAADKWSFARNASNNGSLGTPIMTWDATNNSVGIGTTAPLSKLHVNTGTNQNFRVRTGTDVGATNGVALNSRTDDDSALQQLALRASDVIMLPSGGVGINTSTPQTRLDVFAGSNNSFAASIGSNLGVGNWSGLSFGYFESANNLYRKSALVFERTGGSAQGNIHFLLNNLADVSSADLSNSVVKIAGNGNFLIGTTTDTGEKLQVFGNAVIGGTGNPALSISSTSGAYTSLLYLNASGGGASKIFANGGANQLFLGTNNNERLTIDSNGIRTENPTGGTSNYWKLGSRVAAAVALDATQYIELEVGGTLYKLAIVT